MIAKLQQNGDITKENSCKIFHNYALISWIYIGNRFFFYRGLKEDLKKSLGYKTHNPRRSHVRETGICVT
jgi:hypothetical protein